MLKNADALRQTYFCQGVKAIPQPMGAYSMVRAYFTKITLGWGLFERLIRRGGSGLDWGIWEINRSLRMISNPF